MTAQKTESDRARRFIDLRVAPHCKRGARLTVVRSVGADEKPEVSACAVSTKLMNTLFMTA